MNREIKFRAWDGEQMHKNVSPWRWDFVIDNSWHRCERSTGGGILGIGGKDAEMLVPAKRFTELMQYTGQNDRHGTEIYEGDIVRILYSDWASKSDKDSRTLEQYLTDIAEVKVVIWEFNGFYVSNEVDGYAESMSYGKHGYIEVIGNIYQNAELLKKAVK